MPRNHKPSEVVQAITWGSSGKPYKRGKGTGHICPKSPTGSRWWVIGSPKGETSTGVCRYCGGHREFANAPAVAFTRGRIK